MRPSHEDPPRHPCRSAPRCPGQGTRKGNSESCHSVVEPKAPQGQQDCEGILTQTTATGPLITSLLPQRIQDREDFGLLAPCPPPQPRGRSHCRNEAIPANKVRVIGNLHLGKMTYSWETWPYVIHGLSPVPFLPENGTALKARPDTENSRFGGRHQAPVPFLFLETVQAILLLIQANPATNHLRTGCTRFISDQCVCANIYLEKYKFGGTNGTTHCSGDDTA